MADCYLGIDTSCYTTSAALIDDNGKVMSECRQILSVRPGNCGLQQSEMVFQHTRNLPRLIEECLTVLGKHHLRAITVSGMPRPIEGSYMPAFLSGLAVARSLAAALPDCKLHVLSHQENHMEAGVWSAGGPKAERFLMLHASGGTTDLLLVEPGTGTRSRITQVGGSKDLHAGQFVDRVGVALGLQFPTGPALEQLAATADIDAAVELPVSVQKLDVSLSGPCTAALRRLEAGAPKAELALGVEICLAETFVRMIRNAAAQYNVYDCLLVGGVGSNSYIRRHLESKLAKRRIRLWVPEAKYSPDNACGNAAYGYRISK